MKRQIALVLAAMMTVSLLAACGAGGAAGTAPAAEEPVAAEEEAAPAAEETAPAAEEAAPAEEEAAPAAEETAETEEWQGDIDEINILLVDQRGNGESIKSIEDALNAITEKTIGVHANIKVAGFGDYNTQFGLIVSSGESLDVASLVFQATGFTTLYANGQLTDITDIIEEQAPELMDLMGEYIVANSVGGRIYGVPPYRNYASANYLYMRNDILDELGIMEEAKAIDSFSALEEVFAKVQAGTKVAPIGTGVMESGIIYTGDKFEDYYTFDALGDAYRLIYTDDDGHVSLLNEREDYRKMMDIVKGWYDKKYLYQDMLITDDHADTVMGTGVLFSNIALSEMGVETAKKAATGYDVTVIEMSKNLLTSSTVNKFGLCVPITSEEPEAAVRWINAIYTEPELINILNWGIEGRDYVVTETGEADYPEGVDASSVPYHAQDFFWGNYFNTIPWAGTGADFRQRAYDYLKSADVSPYMGFAADQSGLESVVGAINTVYLKYYKDIGLGAYDDAKWDAYISELYTAGLQDYLDAYQEQLDAWRATAGK